MEWRTMESAPTDKTQFVALDAKHGRVFMRRWYEGKTLFSESWPLDPCGIIDPPEPYLWKPTPPQGDDQA